MSNKLFCAVPCRQRGVALVMTLAMLVLVTFAIVAFFAKATNNRKVENSSVGGARAEVLARSVSEAIIGELQKEILAGSNPSYNTPDSYGNYVLRPKTAQDAVPQTVLASGIASPIPAKFNNLVKQSISGKPFYNGTTGAAAVIRAVAVKTSEPSLDGRVVSMNRWNGPQLVGSGSSGSTGFDNIDQLPEWVLVTRSGIKSAISVDEAKNTGSSDFVIGRFAYNIYNEGGLLDINIAGYPSDLASSSRAGELKIIKGGIAGADLTQIPGVPNQAAVDRLIDWRNSAGIAHYTLEEPTAFSGYTKLITQFSGTTGNLQRWINDTLTSGDQRFISRQDLIRFIRDSGLSDISVDALPFLGTFSRSLNQPSYWPDPARPKVTGPASTTTTGYTGGNNAYQWDDIFNPAFQKIRVTKTTGKRNDDSNWIVGEPLVKKRFALRRLAWLTHIGPIASDSGHLNDKGDARLRTIIDELKEKYGYSEEFLKKGTADNIYKYFGLRWTRGLGLNGLGGYWTYQHGVATTIGSLEDAAAANREPDFFEMLKATISVGSLGKAWLGTGATDWRVKSDTNVNFQILQIGANIIDQADLDDFPTQLAFVADVYNTTNAFWGNENLPYLSMLGQVAAIVRDPDPNTEDGKPTYPPVRPVDPGQGAAFQVPFVWNPFSSASRSVPSLAPTRLRTCITMVARDGSATGASLSMQAQYDGSWQENIKNPEGVVTGTSAISASGTNTSSLPVMKWNLGSYESASGTVRIPADGGGINTSLYFKTNSTLYRDPTPLMRPGKPDGSELSIDSSNCLVTSGTYTTNGIPEMSTGEFFVGFFQTNFSLRWVGVSNTTVSVVGSKDDPVKSFGAATLCTNKLSYYGGNNYPMTCSLEYQDPMSNAWIPYQQVKIQSPIGLGQYVPYRASASNLLDSFGHYNAAMNWDPRSARWSMITDVWLGRGYYRPGTDLVAFLDKDRTVCESARPFAQNFTVSHGAAATGAGWYATYNSGTGTFVGSSCQNLEGSPSYYKDCDGIVRRGMAGAVTQFNETWIVDPSVGSTVGIPLAAVYSGSASYGQKFYDGSANMANRPVMLNRPFQNVVELGYVGRDTPWKNLDFSMPESGDSALLDAFCIDEDVSTDAVTAGKVDLNTRQTPVIQAILSAAYRDETSSGNLLSATAEAEPLAEALVNRTKAKPLSNIADLVGRFESGFINENRQPYDGFSADLNLYSGGSISGNNLIQRYRETAMRALSGAGMAGTWNLLIDVVAQTGRYPKRAGNLSDFMVEGEKRYWIHVAIDRQSGKVIDQQIEQVSE